MDQITPALSALLDNGDAYEDIIARLYRRLLRPGDVAVDGGSGRGRDTFAMAGLVGESGRVIACEPIPWLAERLRLDRARRGLAQVAVHRVALAPRGGEAPFLWVRNADAYSALRPRPYPMPPEIEEVPVTLARLDDLLEGEARPWRFGKLDLQGGDLPALQGGARAIAAHRPVLVFHNSREVAAAAHGYDAAAFFAFFEGLGYRLCDLFGRPFGPAEWSAPGRPWYSIAVPAGEAEAQLGALLGPILAEVAHRVADPGLGDLDPWLAAQPQTEHLATHGTRYRETWRRAAIPLMGAREVVELGPASPLGAFLAEQRGVALRTVESDLRFAYAPLEDSADAVLALEMLQRLNDAHTPTSSPQEVQAFLQSGAANMLRESFRILRPGGCLVLTTPNGTSLESIGHLLRRRHAFNYPPHVREYAPAEVVALAESAGFITEMATTFRAWYPPPDIDRDALAQGLGALGFDMAEREDDAFFLFRKPGGAVQRPAAPRAAPAAPRLPLNLVDLGGGRTVGIERLYALQDSDNLFESIITGLYTAVLRPGDLAVDAGANHGLHSYPMAEAVGPQGRLLAIEPIPVLAAALRDGAVARRLPQMELHQVALSDREGTAEFHWIRNADGYSGLQARDYPFKPDEERLQVATVRLDGLLEGATQPWRFIKLDLEGGEFRALQGGAAALARARPVIVFENSREQAARAYGYDRHAYFRFFGGLGYRMFDLFGRPFGLQGWDDESHPWYFIGVAAGSADEALVRDGMAGIVGDALAGVTE